MQRQRVSGGQSAVNVSHVRGTRPGAVPAGNVHIARTCPSCQGAGRVISDPCTKCKGETRVMKEHIVDVAVPAGVEDGTRIRYQEQGDSGPNGGPAGDL